MFLYTLMISHSQTVPRQLNLLKTFRIVGSVAIVRLVTVHSGTKGGVMSNPNPIFFWGDTPHFLNLVCATLYAYDKQVLEQVAVLDVVERYTNEIHQRRQAFIICREIFTEILSIHPLIQHLLTVAEGRLPSFYTPPLYGRNRVPDPDGRRLKLATIQVSSSSRYIP